VGSLKPNKYGLHDMAGNVAEWTLDKYVKDRKKFFGSLTQLIDPWIKATSPYPHVVKGGHYRAEYQDIFLHGRVPSDPAWKASDPQVPKSVWYLTDYPFIGFRVVRPAKVPTAEEMYTYWNSGVEYDD
jgi:formylglycine-generating enzyme required for sulfatase activity